MGFARELGRPARLEEVAQCMEAVCGMIEELASVASPRALGHLRRRVKEDGQWHTLYERWINSDGNAEFYEHHRHTIQADEPDDIGSKDEERRREKKEEALSPPRFLKDYHGVAYFVVNDAGHPVTDLYENRDALAQMHGVEYEGCRVVSIGIRAYGEDLEVVDTL